MSAVGGTDNSNFSILSVKALKIDGGLAIKPEFAQHFAHPVQVERKVQETRKFTQLQRQMQLRPNGFEYTRIPSLFTRPCNLLVRFPAPAFPGSVAMVLQLH